MALEISIEKSAKKLGTRVKKLGSNDVNFNTSKPMDKIDKKT